MKMHLLLPAFLFYLACPATLVSAEQLLPGSPAPQIKVLKWVKGSPIGSFNPGKVYVLEYWATWCGPCKRAMPHLSELAKKYDGKVTFIGVDVMERGEDPLPGVEAFVQKMGDQMGYTIAADGPDKFMQSHWLRAAKAPGIPTTFVVDQTGRVAWIGYPTKVEGILQQVLAGTWDTAAAAKDYKLGAVDMALIPEMNQFMTSGDYTGALAHLEKLVTQQPGLRYRQYVGHYTFCSLCHIDSTRAIEFGRKWIAANDDTPPFDDIVGLVLFKPTHAGKDLFQFALDCQGNAIARFGDATNMPYLLEQQADCYMGVGDQPKAISSAELALADAKKSPTFPADRLSEYEQKLASIKSYHVAQP